jgi:hypothetical protein
MGGQRSQKRTKDFWSAPAKKVQAKPMTINPDTTKKGPTTSITI